MFMCFVNWSSVVNLFFFMETSLFLHYCTCLGHLGQRDTRWIISIDQGKYSHDCRMLLSLMLHQCTKAFTLLQDSYQGILTERDESVRWPPFTNSIRLAAFDTETLFFFITKQTIFMRRSIVLSLPLVLVFPVLYLARRPETVFATLYFFRNLRLGPISNIV